jgi:hypothetical protein
MHIYFPGEACQRKTKNVLVVASTIYPDGSKITTPIGIDNPIIAYLTMVQKDVMQWMKLPGHEKTAHPGIPYGCGHLAAVDMLSSGGVTAEHRKAIGNTTVCKVDAEGRVTHLRSAVVLTWPQLFLLGLAEDFTVHEIVTAGTLLERMTTIRQRPWPSIEKKANDALQRASWKGRGKPLYRSDSPARPLPTRTDVHERGTYPGYPQPWTPGPFSMAGTPWDTSRPTSAPTQRADPSQWQERPTAWRSWEDSREGHETSGSSWGYHAGST